MEKLKNNNKVLLFLLIAILVSSVISFVLGMISQAVTKNDDIVFAVSSGVFGARRIQQLESPNMRDIATLHKTNGLGDLNFIVKLNGIEIYHSPDYAAFTDHQYRETLLWDKTGEIVVLELMGKRVFAFNTRTQKILQKGELGQYVFFPMPTDNKFYAPLKDIDD